MELGLAGKTVIVTGGGSNIGRGISLAFARERVNLAIADIDETQARKPAAEAEGLGATTLVVKTDVSNWERVQAMVQKALDTFGHIDVLVNNVGWTVERLFIEKPRTEWERKAGVIGLAKTLAREVGKHGVRLNVVCPGTTMPSSEEEVGETSMWAGSFGKGWNTPELRERIAKAYPLRRIGQPEDVANAVVFLASDAASFITGQTLSVSGGYTMM
ncbi:MAG: SDR family oxidoreductase [Deltaproteobacteria bacterium]|nr:SDR family oxidoreductase [Deltaproteobacteria bacterium]